jgi:prepilin-type N-terminal cleavage/methylation domain-containing protein
MHTPPRQGREPQTGLTLIELLVAMIIMAVLSTMLVGGWISLQRSFAFAAADNKARATARDALDRVSSEIRDAQPTPLPTPSSTQPSTPFYFGGSSPYVCGPTSCVFYSAYNNPLAASQSGVGGIGQLRLTAIWLDTSGGAQKTLYWQRDTFPANGDGLFTSADRKVALANNVVNTAAGVNQPIFAYNFYNTTSGLSSQETSLTSAGVATLVSVQVEIIVDANLYHTPRLIDLRTTVHPRNQSTN